MRFPASAPMLREVSLARRKPRVGFMILQFFAVFFLVQIAIGVVSAIGTLVWVLGFGGDSSALMDSSALWLVSLFLTVFETLFAILYCRCIEHRSLRSMGFLRRRAGSEYLGGFLLGAGLFALALGVAMLMGTVSLQAVPAISAGLILLFLLGYLIQGMAEEVLVRGYLMLSLTNRVSQAWAVGISSAVFSLLHIFNPGIGPLPILNLTLFGVLAGIYVLRRGDLWGACAMHSAWNFVQGNVFGISVSGNVPQPSILSATFSETGTLWNGGAFGLEGGLAVTLVLTAAILLILFLPQKSKAPDAGETSNNLD